MHREQRAERSLQLGGVGFGGGNLVSSPLRLYLKFGLALKPFRTHGLLITKVCTGNPFNGSFANYTVLGDTIGSGFISSMPTSKRPRVSIGQ